MNWVCESRETAKKYGIYKVKSNRYEGLALYDDDNDVWKYLNGQNALSSDILVTEWLPMYVTDW